MSNRLHGDRSRCLAQGIQLLSPGVPSFTTELYFNQFVMFQRPIEFFGDRGCQSVLPESDDRFQSVSKGPQLLDLALLQGLVIFHRYTGDRCRLASRK